ncbi:hypothetical protein D3C76_1350750 [compost metagenome]
MGLFPAEGAAGLPPHRDRFWFSYRPRSIPRSLFVSRQSIAVGGGLELNRGNRAVERAQVFYRDWIADLMIRLLEEASCSIGDQHGSAKIVAAQTGRFEDGFFARECRVVQGGTG